MNIKEYNLEGLKKGIFKRQKKLNNIKILLLSLDRTILPPEEGRKNLLAVNNEDEILWIAELPTNVYDSYNDMKYVDGIIRAYSSNSYVSEINPKTGKIIKKYMIK